MSLKLDRNIFRIVRWVALSLVVLFVVIFFVRVAVWEHNYYNEKEGSARAEAVSAVKEEKPVEEEPLIEEQPTEEEVYEYTVAVDMPRYLTVPKLDIYDARILRMGLDSNGALSTPRNIFDVGWYEGSSKPGQGGTMVIDGHSGGPHVHGVFKDLPDLAIGDIITVERGDGTKFNYSVVDTAAININEADSYMVKAMKSPTVGVESVTLISCTGEWSDVQGTYLSRQFVRATLATVDLGR